MGGTMKGATSSIGGESGLVPAPAAGQQSLFLRGDGTWAAPEGKNYSNATTSASGLMSAADKTKLDGITASADSVSFSRSLSNGTKIGSININGTSTDMYAPSSGISKTDLLTYIYPVGSIYMSVNNVSPASFLGGTWEQLKDRFLIGAGNSYTVNGTGGSTAHNHTVTIGSAAYFSIPLIESTSGLYIKNQSGSRSATYSTNVGASTRKRNSGIGGSHESFSHDGFAMETSGQTYNSSSMPPYLAVYMWKRTK